MGTTRNYEVRAQGAAGVAQLADCVNVKRTPHLRDQILAGTFHRVPHPAEPGRLVTVEKPFGYVDPERRQYFLVQPRKERWRFREVNEQLQRMTQALPSVYRENARFRVVFGLAELREKLLAHDASLYDRTLELIKVHVIHQHPFLVQQRRLRLLLADQTGEELVFHALYEHSPRRYEVRVSRGMATQIERSREALGRGLPSGADNMLDAQDSLKWVSIQRWMPNLGALDQLRAVCRELAAGRPPKPASTAFRRMLQALPRGAQLPPWAKQDLDRLFRWAVQRKLSALQDDLFEIRFGRELEDDWALNRESQDIATLYKVLKALPASNVEGNVALREITLTVGEGGGIYDPNAFEVAIGSEELANAERFEDVFRHEIGHAVHEAHQERVDGWLAQEFGWQLFDAGSDAQIDRWVRLLGGWGSASALQIAQMRGYIRAAVGPGSRWEPPMTAVVPASHPWMRPDFKPRLALQRTGANWYANNQAWLQHDGRRFAANYWYGCLMAVNDTTLTLINERMPDVYAAMSPLEFFAELYALHHDRDDPLTRKLPKAIGQWIAANLSGDGAPAPVPIAPIKVRKGKQEAAPLITPRTNAGRIRVRPA